MGEELVNDKVLSFIKPDSYREDWNLEGLSHELHRLFALKFDLEELVGGDVTKVEISAKIAEMVKELYHSKEDAYSPTVMKDAVKYILLTTLDQAWKDHCIILII
jgi:preprotein translocase subunit SecA